MKKLLFLSAFLSLVAHAEKVVPLLEIKEAITVSTVEYIHRGVERARAEKAPALLLEIDTPGGFLESTREIVQIFLGSDDPLILAYVTPAGAHAASAGTMITMAAHFAGMAPSTSIGAATPISSGGHDIEKDLKNKVENDTLAFVTGIAEKRGRNAAWARDAVAKATSSSATEAAQLHVVDGVFATRAELLAAAQKKFPEKLGTEPLRVEPMEHNLKENFLGFISNPNIAFGLLTLGGLGIYLEMSHPGTVVPGAVGALALALGAITLRIVPIRPGAILLLILGLILIAIEVLTPLPTYGVAGAAGALALFLSGLFLLQSGQSDIGLNAAVWVPAFFVVVGFMFFVGYQAVKILRAPGYRQGVGALVGREAVVASGPGETKVLIDGILWNAEPADASLRLNPGEKVQVVQQDGFKVVVRRSSV